MSDPFLVLMGAEPLPEEPNPFTSVSFPPEDIVESIPLQFDPSDDGIPRCAGCKLEILDDEWVDVDDPSDGSKRRMHVGCAPSVYLPPADVPPPRPRRRR